MVTGSKASWEHIHPQLRVYESSRSNVRAPRGPCESIVRLLVYLGSRDPIQRISEIQVMMQSSQFPSEEGLLLQLTAAKEKAAAERLLPTLPVQYTSPMQLRMQLRMQRQSWDESIVDKTKINFQIRQTFLGQEAHYSSTPLHNLKPILLKDMKVREHHKGRYLLCRIMAPPNRVVCTALGVEDPAGWAQLISLYNYPGTYSAYGHELDTLFPPDSVLAVREPFLKMALAASHSHIRVDSPTDLVFIEPGSPLLKKVGWATGERSLPVHTKTASEWKSIGDKHFKAKEFYGAIAGYSLALQREPSLISVRLNRALANLRVGRNIQTVEDARFVLTDEQLPSVDRVKALYRCAQAMYSEGKYAAAKKWYSKCISIDRALADAISGIQRCDSRIQEQATGVYDWRALYEQEMKSPSTQVDVAEFQGPIEKRLMSNRGGGRGIVASRNILAGELLAVSRPFSSGDSKIDGEGGALFALDFLTNCVQKESQYISIQRAISKAALNPGDAATILDLYAGTKYSAGADLFTLPKPSETKSANLPHDIDSTKIEAICLLNSFGGSRSEGEDTSAIDDGENLLYILPSYFNHSCSPNAHRDSIGHTMIIRAAEHIKEGEEITLTYSPLGMSYEERSKLLTKWFPRCDCSLCGHDRDNGPLKRGERKALLERSRNSNLTVEQRRLIAKNVDLTYSSGYGWFRPDSATVHQELAQALERVAIRSLEKGLIDLKTKTLLKESLEEGFKSLEAFGVQVFDKKTGAIPRSQKVSLPISIARIPYDTMPCVTICLCSVGRFTLLGNLNRAEMWMRAALWMESVEKGDTPDLFKVRWATILKNIGDPAFDILDKISRSGVKGRI